MPQLTPAEVDAFLDEPGHLLRVGTVDDDGFPRVVPIWFIRRDDEILFTPRGPSVFLANIRRDPRVGLSIDEDPLPYRKVTVRGTARIVHDVGDDDEWRDLYRSIAKRYVPAEVADAYVDDTIDQPRALIGVPLGGDSRVDDVADARRRRGRHRHLAPPLLPRRHAHGASSPTAGRRRVADVRVPGAGRPCGTHSVSSKHSDGNAGQEVSAVARTTRSPCAAPA